VDNPRDGESEGRAEGPASPLALLSQGKTMWLRTGRSRARARTYDENFAEMNRYGRRSCLGHRRLPVTTIPDRGPVLPCSRAPVLQCPIPQAAATRVYLPRLSPGPGVHGLPDPHRLALPGCWGSSSGRRQLRTSAGRGSAADAEVRAPGRRRRRLRLRKPADHPRGRSYTRSRPVNDY
jgi:hypothetical protein